MSLHESVEPAADYGDFGLADHLAAIERMHREALTELDALVKPWAHLWAARSEEPATVTTETAEFPVAGQPPVRDSQAIAA